MTTYNKLPYSNQFERGHSFNWAGHWKEGRYYYNDSYVTDFVVLENVVLVCRKNHLSSDKPEFVYKDGKIVDIKSPFWEFVLCAEASGGVAITSAEFIANATYDDFIADPNVIIGDPYIKMYFYSGAYLYTPVKDIITQYKVGVPVLTQAMYDELPDVTKPDKWLQIPDETDLTETDAGDYLNILFSAIRKLQAEVTKLKNSFDYGIVSYTGTDTAMSAVVSEYDKTESEEPLWSIDEDDLSIVENAAIDFKSQSIPPFVPVNNFQYNANGVANITGTVRWTDPEEEGFNERTSDTKILLYLTTTTLHDTFNLVGMYDNSKLSIDLSTLPIPAANDNKYNICFLISRNVQLDEDSEEKYGDNYIWISVSSFLNDIVLLEGFYDPSNGRISKSQVNIDTAYTIQSVDLGAGDLYKFKGCSKYQDFSRKVIPSKPNESDYRYKVAHLTIRSVDNFAELESIEDYLLENEMIWQADEDILWIKTKKGLRTIGSSDGGDDSGMTQEEILQMLKDMGIVYVDDTGLQLSDISDITFINEDTGKRFKFGVTSEGELKSDEVPTEKLKDIVSRLGSNLSDSTGKRGFISRLLCRTDGNNIDASAEKSDLRLRSDRLKIGAFYAPLKTDTKFGCSHGYIELENTSDSDIPLDNVYLHFMHPDSTNALVIDKLELDGYIPAGGTYLIRCKQYADPKVNADVFINVNTFDKEWFINGELMDLRVDTENTYGFLLTYGDKDGNNEITYQSLFISKNTGDVDSKAIYSYKWFFIDAIILNRDPSNTTNQYWGYTGNASNAIKPKSNTVIKNTFELDPAKQAYQSHTTYDSSRYRVESKATDVQYLNLDKEYIEFPHTVDKFPVSNYTPKSSRQHKNVSTDKTKLNMDKPNMVTCSFGINAYNTRTFNWISAGQFDEYVWLKSGSNWIKFESYKASDVDKEELVSFPKRKEWSADAINNIYKRIVGDFPGDGSKYTSHKCILQLIADSVDNPTTYTYIVGRADKNGNPDFEHCSEEYTFTLYPTSYIPRIYQTTDQQGFHWIEYQVWAAAADKLNSKILSDCQNENIIPVLLNTGDMTQNGTRINEWLDYYNAGINLFKHLEQVNVVGNNDLCNTDPEILGTGDDNGKSNSFYFHVFYCYEINENNIPLITGDNGDKKYVPSLYYIDFSKYRFVVVNSEITYVNCDAWFNRHKTVNGTKYPINVYTGWAISNKEINIDSTNYFDSGFTSIYTMVYNMLNSALNKNIITICHEMPFTVITKDGLSPANKNNYRSLSGSSKSLVGSHTNQINGYDVVGIHWFSRLMEFFNVKLCLGGHKHTYACTFPICEYYYYDNGNKNSLTDGFMTMESTLENDLSVTWKFGETNLTKKPLIDSSWSSSYDFTEDTLHFSPVALVDLSDTTKHHPVVYMMCQASGYKLTSNKELPSTYQHFSRVIPETSEGSGSGSDTADTNQQFPMICITKFTESNNSVTYSIELARIHNILNNKQKFTQQAFGTKAPLFSYANINQGRFISWTIDKDSTTGAETETTLITI